MGRHTWALLHSMAAAYPEKPSEDDVEVGEGGNGGGALKGKVQTQNLNCTFLDGTGKEDFKGKQSGEQDENG